MNSMKTMLVLLAVFALAVGCGQKAAQEPAAPTTPSEKAQPPAEPNTPVTVESTPAEGKAAPTDAVQAPEPPAPPEVPEPNVPEVVAKINGEPISGKEFGRRLKYVMQMMQARGMPVQMDDARRKEILNAYIDEKVLDKLVKESGTTVSDEEFAAEFQKRKAKIPSEEEYQNYLKAMQLTEDELKTMLRESMLKDKYFEEKNKGVTVSDEEVNAEYERLKGMGHMQRQGDTTDVAHILAMAEGADQAKWDAAKKKIDDARARIVAGEKFEDVAKEVSEDPGSKENGGLYEDTAAGKMVPEFEKMMNDTPIGGLSEPFKTDYGWHILTVKGKHAAGPISIEEIKPQLSDMLQRKKSRDMAKQLVDEARAKMNIELLYPPEGEQAATPNAPVAPETVINPQPPAEPAVPAEPAAAAEPAAPAAPKGQ